jgi:crossover junction endodeoxyribonuclease RuvC
MITIGIDPGLGTTGYGIVQLTSINSYVPIDYGAILTPVKQPLSLRLQVLYDSLTELLHHYQPDYAAVERLFFARNITTAITVGQARGVAMLALAQAGLDVVEYSPPEIKEAVTGYGNADKHQIQVMVQSLLGLKETPKPDDAADGLAIAICHLQRVNFTRLVDEAEQ